MGLATMWSAASRVQHLNSNEKGAGPSPTKCTRGINLELLESRLLFQDGNGTETC